MNPSLAAVLQRADIWRGDQIAVSPAPTLRSGFARLDAELPGGGWPRGQLTELLPQYTGIGELTLLLPALAALTTAGASVVLVSPPHQVHAPAWAAAGVRLDRLTLLFPRRPRDALWAGVEAVRCGGVAATLAWLETDPPGRTQLPVNSLRRLHVAAGEGGGCAFLLRPAALATSASPASLRLHLQPAGRQLQVNLLKRRGPPARQPLLLDISRPAAHTRSFSQFGAAGSVHAVADAPLSPLAAATTSVAASF